MSTVIGARRRRVWRALTSADEIVRWDERVGGWIGPRPDYPRPGVTLRWRYRLGRVPIVLREEPLEIAPCERLRSRLILGPIRFDGTWTLGEEASGRTRLGLKLSAEKEAPVLGEVLDRFDVRRVAAEFIDAKLRQLQRWCEAPRERRAGAPPPVRCEGARGPTTSGPRSVPV